MPYSRMEYISQCIARSLEAFGEIVVEIASWYGVRVAGSNFKALVNIITLELIVPC